MPMANPSLKWFLLECIPIAAELLIHVHKAQDERLSSRGKVSGKDHERHKLATSLACDRSRLIPGKLKRSPRTHPSLEELADNCKLLQLVSLGSLKYPKAWYGVHDKRPHIPGRIQ